MINSVHNYNNFGQKLARQSAFSMEPESMVLNYLSRYNSPSDDSVAMSILPLHRTKECGSNGI